MARRLLIDDDEASLDFIRYVMRVDGHELADAADGDQGLALVQQFRPELITCDVVMAKPFDLEQLHGADGRCLGQRP